MSEIKTIYTVPAHVGRNIEVPGGSKISFYGRGWDLDEVVKLSNIQTEVRNEVERAARLYPPFASLHEGWAILEEEVEELWDEVKKSPKRRDPVKIREEAVQVAAMAIRFLYDLTEATESDVKA